MKLPLLLPLPLSLILNILLFLIVAPMPQAVKDENYKLCSQSYKCGSIGNINYPFWGNDRPDYCGLQDFELVCDSKTNHPIFNMDQQRFLVLAIDPVNPTMSIVRSDLLDNVCTENYDDTTIDAPLFKYNSDTEHLTLYYFCDSGFLDTITEWRTKFTCESGGGGCFFVNESSLDSVQPQASQKCKKNLTVPVSWNHWEMFWEIKTWVAQDLVSKGFEVVYELETGTKCEDCKRSDGMCGTNSTHQFTCFCKDGTQMLSCPPGQDGGPLSPGVIAILASGSAIILIIIITCCCVRRYRTLAFCKERGESENCKNRAVYENIEAIIRNHVPYAPKRYRYSDVNKITNSFKDKLGQGGYGTVYKGKLSDGRLVAVKVLSETETNREDFVNEVISISRTSHVNVVTLLGFCLEKKKRALIYEFMVRGSLDKLIGNDESIIERLDCRTLHQIAVGVARGLEYLHRGCNARIVHFDIKPHNILLDENFCPKISDFGLAKLCQSKQSIISMLGARGTVGYIAPEVFSRTFGAVSHKSDVYSFGMLVLEIIGAGKKGKVIQNSEAFFPDWIYEHLEHGKELPVCAVNTGEEEEIVKKMILVGLWCIQTKPSDRPPMSKVVEMLEGTIESLQIPPKPCLFCTTIPDLSLQNSSEALPLVNIVGEVLQGSLQSSEIKLNPT